VTTRSAVTGGEGSGGGGAVVEKRGAVRLQSRERDAVKRI
jgi:hypothetical protein